MLGGKLSVIVLTLLVLATPVQAEADASTVFEPFSDANCFASGESSSSRTGAYVTTSDGFGVVVSAAGHSARVTVLSRDCVEAGEKSSRAAQQFISEIEKSILERLP